MTQIYDRKKSLQILGLDGYTQGQIPKEEIAATYRALQRKYDDRDGSRNLSKASMIYNQKRMEEINDAYRSLTQDYYQPKRQHVASETESDNEYISTSTDHEADYKIRSFQSGSVLTGNRNKYSREYAQTEPNEESMSILRQSVEHDEPQMQQQEMTPQELQRHKEMLQYFSKRESHNTHYLHNFNVTVKHDKSVVDTSHLKPSQKLIRRVMIAVPSLIFSTQFYQVSCLLFTPGSQPLALMYFYDIFFGLKLSSSIFSMVHAQTSKTRLWYGFMIFLVYPAIWLAFIKPHIKTHAKDMTKNRVNNGNSATQEQ